MLTAIVVLCWLPVSWLLHSFLHENAHASAARYFGFKTAMKLYPHDGMYASFTMTRNTAATREEARAIFSAPVLPEVLWILFFGMAGWSAYDTTAGVYFSVESVVGGVDLLVWMLSLARFRPGKDGTMWAMAVDSDGNKRKWFRIGGAVAAGTIIIYIGLTSWFKIIWPLIQSMLNM